MKQTYAEQHLFQILRRFENQHLPLDLFLAHYFRSHRHLGSHDRRFIAETTYGIIRWRYLLDFLTDDAASWERRYGVFKQMKPTQFLHANAIPLHIRLSFPEALFKLLVSDYGEDKAILICLKCNEAAPTTIRVNPLKIARAEFLQRWQGLYEMSPCTLSPLGIQFKRRYPLFATPEFKEGLFEVQDEGSQLLALLLRAKPGDWVLDYCAGSGGKTLAFAHLLQGKGVLFLHDDRPHALKQAKKRLARAGVYNAQIIHSLNPSLEKIKHKMDWVFVDVPCTGTGTMRRNPDMKEKFSLALLDQLVKEQRAIFAKALDFLSPTGRIVYATCSLLRKENEEQVEHFLTTYGLEMEGSPFVSLPHTERMDGFFGAVLKLSTPPSKNSKHNPEKEKGTAS